MDIIISDSGTDSSPVAADRFTYTGQSASIDQTQKQFSVLAAQSSLTNVTDSVTGAIDDGFSGAGTTSFAPGRIATSFSALEQGRYDDSAPSTSGDRARSAFAGLPTKARGPERVSSPWHLWIDARYTMLDDHSAARADGWHLNASGGVSYRFGDGFLAGVLVGYEDFRYTQDSISSKLDGNGWTGGGYFAWKFYQRLRLEGMMAYTRLSYGAQAAATTGSFGADRYTSSLGLVGRWALLRTWYVEPSMRVLVARELQDQFTDTAAVLHGENTFTVGRASFGAELGKPIVVQGAILTPAVGLYGDYRFGTETVLAASTVGLVQNGWSMRPTGKLTVQNANGLTSSIAAEYGGIGQDTRYWRFQGNVGLRF